MNIRQRIQILSFSAVLIGLTAVPVLIWQTNKSAEHTQNISQLDALTRNTIALTLLDIHSSQPRQQQQLNIVKDALKENSTLLLSNNNVETDQLFEQVQTLLALLNTLQHNSETPLKHRQMAISVQSVIDAISHMQLEQSSLLRNHVQTSTYILTSIVAFALILLILGLAWLGHYLVKGLNQLHEGVQQVQAGNWPQIITIGHDEICDISQSFNHMVKQLQNKTEQLNLALDIAQMGIWELKISDYSLIWDERLMEIYTVPIHIREQGITYDFWRNRCHPNDVESVEQLLESALTGATFFDTTFRIILNDGRIRYLRALAVVQRDPSGRPHKMTGINYDITTQYEQANHLKQLSIQAEAANQAKSDFLANMSHEIRTPMNAIIGLTDIVLDSELQSLQRSYLSKVKDSSGHLLHILNDILDFSKIEAGKLEIEKTPFSLFDIKDHLTALYDLHAKDKSLVFKVNIIPPQVQNYLSDALRLTQILSNLISNAIKFTHQGSITVDIEVNAVNTQQDLLSISVTDTGIGMNEQQQKQLFKAFNQADSSITRQYGGTGLGLSISQRLLKLLGGKDISITSDVDKGSCFSFQIPLDKTDLKPEKKTEAITAPLMTGNILLVEDIPTNQIVAEAILNKLGMTIDIAHNGQHAVNKVRERHYDLILMDLQMPVMDGFDATQCIRQFPNEQTTPILAMTAAATSNDRAAALAAGMNDHLAKPIDLEVLTCALQKWLPQQASDRVLMQPALSNPPEKTTDAIELPGFNLNAAVAPFAGNWTLMHKLLQSFVKDFASANQRISEYITANDLELARREVHSIKGLAGTFHIPILREAAQNFEQDLKKGLTTRRSTFEHALEDALNAIATLNIDN